MYSPRYVLLVIIVLAIILFIIGVAGYHLILEEDVVHSIYATSLTMAGLSLEAKPQRNDQKIFISIFTILSVGFYLIFIAAIIACLLQPFFADITIEYKKYDN